MRHILIGCILLGVLGMQAGAQTRRIGHRSHSGQPATFALWMEEDHLGEFTPRATYEVEPFVAKVRQHYEQVARQNPGLQAQDGHGTKAGNGAASNAVPKQDTASNAPRGPVEQGMKEKARRPKRGSAHGPSVDLAVPAPPFLVGTRLRAAAAIADAAQPIPVSQPANRLWLLWGLIAFPIAPGLMWVSGAMRRREP